MEVCLTGYQNAVHISGIFDLEAARAKFLEKIVSCTKIANLREISRKEVDSIRSLTVIFLFDGDHLGVDWVQVFIFFIDKSILKRRIGTKESFLPRVLV